MKATQSSEGVTPGAVLTGSSEHASAHEGPNPAPLHRHVIGGGISYLPGISVSLSTTCLTHVWAMSHLSPPKPMLRKL